MSSKSRKPKKNFLFFIAVIILAAIVICIMIVKRPDTQESAQTGSEVLGLADASDAVQQDNTAEPSEEPAGPVKQDTPASPSQDGSQDEVQGPLPQDNSQNDEQNGSTEDSRQDASQDQDSASSEVQGPPRQVIVDGQTIEIPADSDDAQDSDGASQAQASDEGTLSPSHGTSAFTQETDEALDGLLTQISNLLPQNNGTWSVYVCNLQNGSDGTVNEQPMQAASLIKLYIMGAVYENYEALSQQYGSGALDTNLNSMITVSDNDAANTLVNWLGGGDNATGMQRVNEFCQSHGYTSTSMGRMLLASNEYGDNYTSVYDCGRFLKEVYQICNGTAVSPTLSHAESMYSLLKQQTRTHKIPANMPDGVHVANKTGELSDVENDAGIVYDTAKGVDLVICFMSQSLTDTAAAQSSIAQNSRTIYAYYNE